MSISGVSNDGIRCYHSSVSKTDAEQTTFSLDGSEEKVQEIGVKEKKFPGNTLAELFETLSSGRVRADSIPVVDQIISAKNPEDAEVREAGQLPSAEDVTETEKVTDIGVVSLSNGVSFYFNDDTGEVTCINDNDSRPGRQVMWSKVLSSEEMARCDKLFDNYKDEAAGHFVFRYKAYLEHEEFWDMYLDGKVDLTALIQEDDIKTQCFQGTLNSYENL